MKNKENYKTSRGKKMNIGGIVKAAGKAVGLAEKNPRLVKKGMNSERYCGNKPEKI